MFVKINISSHHYLESCCCWFFFFSGSIGEQYTSSSSSFSTLRNRVGVDWLLAKAKKQTICNLCRPRKKNVSISKSQFFFLKKEIIHLFIEKKVLVLLLLIYNLLFLVSSSRDIFNKSFLF